MHLSGVIADVLWGIETVAINNGVITTATFGVCVRSRTAERAKDYRLELHPECTVDAEAAVLYNAANPPQGPPDLQPWPPVEILVEPPFVDPRDGFDPIHGRWVPRDRVFYTDWPPHREPEADVVGDARKRTAGEVRRSLVQIRPSAGPSASNLIVSGNGARPWSRDPVELRSKTSTRIGFRVESDVQGSPILVELPDGSFTPIVPYGGLYAVVKQSTAGDVFQAYGQHNSRKAFRDAIEAIVDFAAGGIRADRIDELAGRLRHGKHADPVLGAICAYLFRAIADFDSIRRMAYFYVKYGQPVPFDIARYWVR